MFPGTLFSLNVLMNSINYIYVIIHTLNICNMFKKYRQIQYKNVYIYMYVYTYIHYTLPIHDKNTVIGFAISRVYE